MRIDARASKALPGEQKQLTMLTDEYQLQVMEYHQQNYSEQTNAIVQMAAVQQSTDEGNLLKQFHLTPDQQQALMVQFSVPGRPAGTVGGSGLPTHPPNALAFTPQRRNVRHLVVTNASTKDILKN